MATNPYCEKLGVEVPRLEDVIAHDKRTKLFHLMIAALVENGGPMTLEQIAERMAAVGVKSKDGDLQRALQRAWHGSEPVYRLPTGAFALDLKSQFLDLILYMTGIRPPKARPPAASFSATTAKEILAGHRPTPRIAVVRAVPVDAPTQAVSLLDPEERSIATFVGEALGALRSHLDQYDVLVGLDVRSTLHYLDLEPDHWELVDLGSVRKTVTLNRRGRTLRVTPELLITSSTGISRPLGDAKKIQSYLASDQQTRLIRRLESDVKALHAHYRYGKLHGWVRLRWGFVDELLRVWWGPRGTEDLEGILSKAAATGDEVDLIVGTAPGWEQPWKRAQRGKVARISEWEVWLRQEAGDVPIDRYLIQAVRIADRSP